MKKLSKKQKVKKGIPGVFGLITVYTYRNTVRNDSTVYYEYANAAVYFANNTPITDNNSMPIIFENIPFLECESQCLSEDCFGFYYDVVTEKCKIYNEHPTAYSPLILRPHPCACIFIKSNKRNDFQIDDRSKSPTEIIITYPFTSKWNRLGCQKIFLKIVMHYAFSNNYTRCALFFTVHFQNFDKKGMYS